MVPHPYQCLMQPTHSIDVSCIFCIDIICGFSSSQIFYAPLLMRRCFMCHFLCIDVLQRFSSAQMFYAGFHPHRGSMWPFASMEDLCILVFTQMFCDASCPHRYFLWLSSTQMCNVVISRIYILCIFRPHGQLMRFTILINVLQLFCSY